MKAQNRPFAALLALVVLTASVSAQDTPPRPSPPPATAPTFPSGVEVVTVDVVVTDKKGVPVTGLTRDDFQILEDDKPQAIASFDAVEIPAAPSAAAPVRLRVSTNATRETRTGRTFVILFDDIHLTPFNGQRAKAAVAEFLRSGVREGDRVSLVSTGGGAWWSTRMEAGRDELIAMVKRLEGRHIPDRSPERLSDYEAMRIHAYRDPQVEERVSRRFETYGATSRAGRSELQDSFSEGDPLVRARAAEIYYQSVARNRITLQVLERVLTSLASSKGRKSLVLVSDGFIYDPNLDEFKKAVSASRRSNAAIYFVDTKGLGGMPTHWGAEFGPAIPEQDVGSAFMDNLAEAEGAESLAADSGGFSVKNTNDLTRGIRRITDETRSYYLIGYHPSDQRRDGRFRKIQVRLASRKGVQVRARKGYYAPLDGPRAAEAKPTGIDVDIQAALDSPYDEQQVPLRMASYVFDETLLGKASTLVATDIDIRGFAFEEKDGRFLDTMEVLLVVAHRESGEFFRYDQKVEMNLRAETKEKLGKTWFSLVRDFELAPGGYQAKVVVRDKRSGRIGTVVHEFEVPAFSGLRVSTPILSDTLPRDAEGKPTGRPSILARRTFAPDATLFTQFEVYGAGKDKPTGMPRVTAGFTIRRLDGTGNVINETTPTRITPTSLGRLSRLIGTPLQGSAPGEYELVLSLKDEIAGQSIEIREPFEIAPGGTQQSASSNPLP